jgi:hypothetical protein
VLQTRCRTCVRHRAHKGENQIKERIAIILREAEAVRNHHKNRLSGGAAGFTIKSELPSSLALTSPASLAVEWYYKHGAGHKPGTMLIKKEIKMTNFIAFVILPKIEAVHNHHRNRWSGVMGGAIESELLPSQASTYCW